MLGPYIQYSVCVYGSHAQHAMLGAYTEYSVGSSYLRTRVSHTACYAGALLCGVPISTWGPCPACYAGALYSV